MYKGSVLATAAAGSIPTCGPVLHVACLSLSLPPPFRLKHSYQVKAEDKKILKEKKNKVQVKVQRTIQTNRGVMVLKWPKRQLLVLRSL